MFRGYAKFPGVGIRAMPVAYWSFDLTRLRSQNKITTIQPGCAARRARLSNIVLAAKFVRAVTGPGVRFSLLVARIVHFLLVFLMN